MIFRHNNEKVAFASKRSRQQKKRMFFVIKLGGKTFTCRLALTNYKRFQPKYEQHRHNSSSVGVTHKKHTDNVKKPVGSDKNSQ